MSALRKDAGEDPRNLSRRWILASECFPFFLPLRGTKAKERERERRIVSLQFLADFFHRSLALGRLPWSRSEEELCPALPPSCRGLLSSIKIHFLPLIYSVQPSQLSHSLSSSRCFSHPLTSPPPILAFLPSSWSE